MKIYFNPRCSKCRIADAYLVKNEIKAEKVLYLEKGITKDDLKTIISKGVELDALIRKKESDYVGFIKGKNLTDDEIFNVIIKYPKILQRPIIVGEKKAIIARDEESLERIKSLK